MRKDSEKPDATDLPDTLSYAEARNLLVRADTIIRTELAGRQDIEPEMLYYLASDDNPEVRRAAAANSRTPLQADATLAGDSDDEVRSELARKIGRLIPSLDDDALLNLREKTIQILETLARDQLPRVRAIVAEEIKACDSIPKHIVLKLARDVEAIVSAPVLEYSPLLDDADLKEIIAAGTASGALEAIARRTEVSESVSAEIVASLDIPALTSLLANKNAQIREDTLDMIIGQATEIHGLHAPLALRTDLSSRAVRRIAGFVASALVEIMVTNNQLEPSVAEEITATVRNRVKHAPLEDDSTDTVRELVEKHHHEGTLDEDFIIAAIDDNKVEIVFVSLMLLASITYERVLKMVHTQNGVIVAALAWKAGLSMRVALRLQTEIAHVPPHKILNAREGLYFPLTEEQMQWHLDYFE